MSMQYTPRCPHNNRIPYPGTRYAQSKYVEQCMTCLRLFTVEEVLDLERTKYAKVCQPVVSDRIIVTFSCGHQECRPRPTGVTDPKTCLCLACHPEPTAVRQYPCDICVRKELHEEIMKMRAERWW